MPGSFWGYFPTLQQLQAPQWSPFAQSSQIRRILMMFSPPPFMGPNAEIHDELAQCPGSFRRTIRGIRLLLDAGVWVVANMVVSKRNKGFLKETAKLAKSVGIKSFSSTRAGCPGNCPDFSQFSLTLQDFRDYLESLYQVGAEERIRVGVLESYPLCAIKEVERYLDFTGRHCFAGVTTLTVADDGAVRPCSHLD
ncbi:MAG: hypothetical protein AAB686_02195, partial [Patescibacteria group bacterium]